MSAFRRTLQFLFTLVGFLVGLAAALALYFSRLMVAPPRQRLWGSPGDVGLDFETVQFPAQDGLRLAGWFIPAPPNSLRKGATLIFVHGWGWNRLGDSAEDLMSNINGAMPVDMLRLALHLHHDGFNLLMFDLRNHGESAAMPPMTFGLEEAKDVMGALTYLHGRSGVDPQRIGVVGFAMGANAMLYAMSQTDAIQAAVAVQPTSPYIFSERYANYLLGPFGKVLLPLIEQLYQLQGGPKLSEIRPISAAANAGDAPILFLQGQGDTWGSVADVQQMTAVAPHGSGPIIADTSHRFEGYHYLIDHPEIVTAFFEQHFPE